MSWSALMAYLRASFACGSLTAGSCDPGWPQSVGWHAAPYPYPLKVFITFSKNGKSGNYISPTLLQIGFQVEFAKCETGKLKEDKTHPFLSLTLAFMKAGCWRCLQWFGQGIPQRKIRKNILAHTSDNCSP